MITFIFLYSVLLKLKELAELQDLLFVAEMIAVWTLHFSSTYHLQITVCEI